MTFCIRTTTHIVMYTVKFAPTFEKWFSKLKDRVTRLRLARRLDRAACGNLGDVKPVGNGVYEMREVFGPGWRMYYIIKGDILIVMLCGGDKATQQADIEKAQEIAATWGDK